MSEKQSYRDSDDMPTERAVLEREWKAMRLALSMPRAAVQAAQAAAVGEVCKALIRAWELGQVYAQQSHSEARSLESHTAFVALLDKTRAALASAPTEPMSAPTAEPVAWNDTQQASLNDWFLSLPEGRQKVLADDKWMLAGAAFLAGQQVATPPSAATPEPSDAERYQLLRRGQHWSVIDGIGNVLRGDDLDAAVDSILAARLTKDTP